MSTGPVQGTAAAAIDDVGTLRLIRQHPVFNGLSDEELRSVLPFFNLVNARQGQLLIEEGLQQPIVLYLVLNGGFEVIKNAEQLAIEKVMGIALDQFIIAKLSAGDVFGELSFIRGEAKSASIRCMSKSKMLTIERATMSRLEATHPQVAVQILKNVIGIVGDRLKSTSNEEVKAMKVSLNNSLLSSKSNLFFSYVIGLLCVYNLALQLITSLSVDPNQTSLISAGIIVVFGGVLLLMIRQSTLPGKMFGLTLEGWRPALKDALLWTGCFVVGIVLLKWFMISTLPQFAGNALFDFDIKGKHYLTFNFLLYGLHTPIQEFVARGVLQGSLQHFFTGRNVRLRAIIVSNALFSATHVHLLHGWFGLLVFLPGLFWGWLYARNENLIGVSVSHLIIGWIALFFLNAEGLFAGG